MSGENRRTLKCLLVDGGEMRATCETVLNGEGVQLVTVRSTEQAQEALLGYDVSLAIIDGDGPDIDGWEVVKLMNASERNHGVPIIFVVSPTELGHASRRANPAQPSPLDFLLEPLEPELLKHKVRSFLQLYRERLSLAESLRLRDDLVGVVCHELRNPLQAILMTASVLSRTSRDPEAIKASERLRSSGNRISRIVDELMEHSRARLAGSMSLELRPLDLRLMTEKAMADLQAGQAERRVFLKVEGSCHGVWDPSRLEQMLSQLLGHALRQSDNGAGPVQVTIAGTAVEIWLRVETEGVTPEAQLSQIFEPFRSREGLGLGLYIVQQIVFAHGGDIEVTSRDARTSFLVRLPRETMLGRSASAPA